MNDPGIMIERQWRELIYRFENIKSDDFVVMPNHFHGIVKFVGVPLVGTQNTEQPRTIGQPQGIAPTGTEKLGEHTGSPLHTMI